MTALTLQLPPELYERLRAEAQRRGKAPEGMAEAWLAERLVEELRQARTEKLEARETRQKVREALRARGILVEPTPAELESAKTVRVTLEEVRALLDETDGPPLSEIIIEQRGPKS